jgi:hypothetical protein
MPVAYVIGDSNQRRQCKADDVDDAVKFRVGAQVSSATIMISENLITKILSQAQTSASHSWEYGTVFEALLEYHNPPLSIFNDPLPHGKIPTVHESHVPALRYVKPFILTDSDQLCEGNGTFISSPILFEHRQSSSRLLFGSHVPRYTRPAPLLYPPYLLSCHDASTYSPLHLHTPFPQWRADFVYMVPPFLAYYGVIAGDEKYVHEASRQCELYSEFLETEHGCWRHIVNAEEGVRRKKDEELWSTGNGWAAAGMARVLATVRKSAFETVNAEQALVNMIQRIINGVMTFDTDDSGLLRNRLNDETWFGEAAGTSMLAATVFRMAVLEPRTFGESYTQWAVRKMEVVSRCVDTETGIVGPVVNPTKDEHRAPLDGISPEAQAFVVLMFAAWRDWNAAVADAV